MTISAPLRLSRYQQAFTLIEMLVVMVILSLLITVIMQGFGYSLGLYQRVVTTQKNAYSEVLAYNWLRSTVSFQVAVRPKDIGLNGSSTQFDTYTFQPLIAESGLKTRIGWALVNDSEDLLLEYHEGDMRFTAYRWPVSTGKIEYLNGETGQWLDRWPVEKSDTPALPMAVKLLIYQGNEARNYVINVAARRRAEVTIDEVLYGRE